MQTTRFLVFGLGMLAVLPGCEDPYADTTGRTSRFDEPMAAPEDVGEVSYAEGEPASVEERLAALTFSDKFDWQLVTSKEGDYSVMMPGKSESRVVGSGYSKIWIIEFSIEHEMFCDAEHINLNPKEVTVLGGSKGALDRWCEKTSGSDARAIVNRRISIAGHPGREWSYRKGSASNPVFYHKRCYVVGNRLYDLSWAWSQGNIDDPDIQAFFESFHLH